MGLICGRKCDTIQMRHISRFGTADFLLPLNNRILDSGYRTIVLGNDPLTNPGNGEIRAHADVSQQKLDW